MITFKTGVSTKEKKEITSTIADLTDIYGDFYITRNNLRLSIKENLTILFDCLKKGDKIAFDENGVGIVVGYSDNAPRKYLKILAKDDKTVEALIKVISWDIKDDLWIKIKKNNPIRKILEKNHFCFKGGRGKEILLIKGKKL